MTAQDLIGLLLRRWYVLLAGAVLSVGSLYLTTHKPGVYYTQFDVVLLAPTEQYYVNKIEDPLYTLAPLAGVLATEWNDTHPPLFTASGDTTLYGEGQSRGVKVRVPNQGSQWQPQYDTATINVQVLDSTPESVAATAQRVSTELGVLLLKSQDAAGIRPSKRVTVLTSPPVPTVDYISGSTVRAAGATGLVGVTSSIALVYWTERLLLWRRSTRIAATPGSVARSADLFDETGGRGPHQA